MRLRGSLLLTLAALSAFGPMSLDLYLPAFPSIADALHVTTGDIQLTFSACLIGLGLGQLVYGPLSDRYGRKPPLLAGLALYVVASLLCAIAPTLLALTGLRLLQGLGGCAGLVISRAIVRDCFEGVALARSFSVISSVSIRRTDVLALRERVEVIPDLAVGDDDRFGARVVVHAHGEVREAMVPYAQGHPLNPMDEQRRTAKQRMALALVTGEPDRIVTALATLPDLADVRELGALLRSL